MDNIIQFKQMRKEGDFMCLPLSKLFGKTADEVILEFGNPNETILDLKSILKKVGISALPFNFIPLSKKVSKEIIGLVMSDGDNAVIYYSDKSTQNRQRFTIAHEIGHICTHLEPSNDCIYIDFRSKEEENNSHEREANIFAGELLIPIKKLKDIYINQKVHSTDKLSTIFGVSNNVMENRLNYLKVSHYNISGQAIVYGDD